MKEPTTHYLKTWPQYYDRVKKGDKKFELRKNDRDFQTGDRLLLQEYLPDENQYTLEQSEYTVDYVLHGPAFGLKKGYCIMSITKILEQ